MDHPRTCGENALMMRAGCSTKGSPPHLRGKLVRIENAIPPIRITPAPAGKTDLCADICQRNKDHPRTCGENMFSITEKPFKEGSPPHLRGKLCYVLSVTLIKRITPAPAGKTTYLLFYSPDSVDHPRTCGENGKAGELELSKVGSPPHLRGKRYLIYYRHSHGGITPAPAGKTSPSSGSRVAHRDHPRTCGENRHGKVLI